jgi:hypothetical protein
MDWDQLIQRTMNEPVLWWTAFAALLQLIQTTLLLVSAVAIFWEASRIRRESVQYKIEGLQIARELLESSELASILGVALKHGPSIQAPVEDWRRALENLSVVELIIARRYADADLILKLKGDGLAALGAYITIHKEQLPEQIQQELSTKYSDAERLLKRAMEIRA